MTSTQSWAAWLLDSYASSVSPVTSHHDDDTFSEAPTWSTSPTHSPMSSISNSSAYGPYVRTGRGGAGNFTWASQQQQQQQSKPPMTSSFSDLAPSRSLTDLEAQKSSITAVTTSLSERRHAAAKLEHIDTQDAIRLRQSSAGYYLQTTGRGGAGNIISTADIAQAKRSPSLPVSMTTPTFRSVSPSIGPGAYPGRGGAGNYAAAADVSARKESEKEIEERAKAEIRREQAVVEVDGLLQPPPGAWLGGRRKSEVMNDEE